MDPVLFLFLMMAFYKILEDEGTDLGIIKAQFYCKGKSQRSTRQLASHQPDTFTSGTLFDIFCILYLDNCVLVFKYKTDIERGITLLSDHFDSFGLEIHIGTGKNIPKTNVYSSCLQVSSTHALHRSLTSPTPPCTPRKKIEKKRDANVSTKNTPSENKQ